MVMRWSVAVLVLLLAGCADSEPVQEANSGQDETQKEDAATLPATEEPGTEPAEPSITEEAFHWEGYVGDWVYACGPLGCAGTSTATSNSESIKGVEAADVRLNWDGLPGQQLAFGIATDCDTGCDFLEWMQGTSPLELAIDGLEPDRSYILVAWHPYQGTPVGAGAQVGPTTHFVVEGTILRVDE